MDQNKQDRAEPEFGVGPILTGLFIVGVGLGYIIGGGFL